MRDRVSSFLKERWGDDAAGDMSWRTAQQVERHKTAISVVLTCLRQHDPDQALEKIRETDGLIRAEKKVCDI